MQVEIDDTGALVRPATADEVRDYEASSTRKAAFAVVVAFVDFREDGQPKRWIGVQCHGGAVAPGADPEVALARRAVPRGDRPAFAA